MRSATAAPGPTRAARGAAGARRGARGGLPGRGLDLGDEADEELSATRGCSADHSTSAELHQQSERHKRRKATTRSVSLPLSLCGRARQAASSSSICATSQSSVCQVDCILVTDQGNDLDGPLAVSVAEPGDAQALLVVRAVTGDARTCPSGHEDSFSWHEWVAGSLPLSAAAVAEAVIGDSGVSPRFGAEWASDCRSTSPRPPLITSNLLDSERLASAAVGLQTGEQLTNVLVVGMKFVEDVHGCAFRSTASPADGRVSPRSKP